MIKCIECFKDCKNSLSLANHIVGVHKISSKNYYDKHIKKEKDGLCKNCNKNTKYYSVKSGYAEYCSKSCLISKRNKENWKNEEYRQSMTEHNKNISKERSKNENFINFRKDLMKKMWKNETYRKIFSKNSITSEEISKRNKENWKNETYRKNISDKTKEQWKNEEYREYMETKTSRGISGIFKESGIYFASSYEAVVIYQLRFLKNKNLQRCPNSLSIKYTGLDQKEHTYYPDFYIPEDNLVIEVKPEYKLKDELVILKIKIASEYLLSKGIKYAVLTEKEIFKNKEDKNIFKMLKENNLIFIYNK